MGTVVSRINQAEKGEKKLALNDTGGKGEDDTPGPSSLSLSRPLGGRRGGGGT